jgi:Uncharacterized protein conserved in bacteria
MRPERHNAVKVLLFLDVGGSMDDHIKVCEELFSACRLEFKHLEYFYFHNCVYEGVWRDNRRRHAERTALLDVIHKYGPDYKLIFVGDATMSPYEILHPHGSVEHMNAEAGATWLRRLLDAYPAAAWLNPEPERLWLPPVDRPHRPDHGRAHVSADAGRTCARHAGAVAQALNALRRAASRSRRTKKRAAHRPLKLLSAQAPERFVKQDRTGPPPGPAVFHSVKGSGCMPKPSSRFLIWRSSFSSSLCRLARPSSSISRAPRAVPHGPATARAPAARDPRR